MPKQAPDKGDFVTQLIAEAATDIRRHAVEAPWFGSPVDQDDVDGRLFQSEPEAQIDTIDGELVTLQHILPPQQSLGFMQTWPAEHMRLGGPEPSAELDFDIEH